MAVYNCSTGMDIGIFQDTVRIGTAAGINFSITKEMAPIYRYPGEVVDADRRQMFSRGKKGIAGEIIFDNLDRDQIFNNRFNIRIKSMDEYGKIQTMAITGMELIREGLEINLKDCEFEKTYTFVARDIIPWG